MRARLFFSFMVLTPLAISAASAACGGFAGDSAPASNDADTSSDSSFGSPVLVRRAPVGEQLAMRADALGTDFFFSQGTLSAQFMYRSSSAGDGGARVEINNDGGPLFGLAPTPLTVGGNSIVVYGTIGYVSQARLVGTIADSRVVIDTKIDGGGGSFPYVLPNGTALYFSANNQIYRCAYGILTGCSSTIAVTIRSATSTPISNSSFAVVSPDEQTLYFAAAGLTSLSRIWVATRAASASDEIVFDHAEPLAFPDSDKNDAPMWVSTDGKLIYFHRSEAAADGGTESRIYSITRP